jgi:DNA-3-methyladenine glycosylase I
MSRSGSTVGGDGKARCWWAGSTPDYLAYHDHEWGFPVADDHRLFEKVCLEGFQSGLSWLTILRKRDAFRRAFADFDYAKVARFTPHKVERLLGDPGIVRHRGKIESTINNARRALELAEGHGSLAAYVWQFEPPKSERPRRVTKGALQGLAHTPTSRALAKDLKKRGWSYVGPTTVYAFMQAMGLVNDHLERCHVRPAAQRARTAFEPPG